MKTWTDNIELHNGKFVGCSIIHFHVCDCTIKLIKLLFYEFLETCLFSWVCAHMGNVQYEAADRLLRVHEKSYFWIILARFLMYT